MSNMDKDKDFSYFVALGEKYGLTADEALLTFAREELVKYQNELRDRHSAVCAAEKAKLEAEEKSEKAKLGLPYSDDYKISNRLLMRAASPATLK